MVGLEDVSGVDSPPPFRAAGLERERAVSWFAVRKEPSLVPAMSGTMAVPTD